VCEEHDCGYLSAVFFFIRSAIRAYQQVLYLDTQFVRRADIHLRLGLIYKQLADYSTSLKHFQRALTDSTGGCSLTRSEISYLIGLIYEQQGNTLEAQNIYEKLLQESLPLKLEGLILRQLGCLYFSIDHLHIDKEDQIKKAIITLEKALKCNPTCGLTYYYLGRCHAALKNHTEAFFTYRNCVDKLDQNADIWCSIGFVISRLKFSRIFFFFSSII
jgi:histone demethylase